MRKSAALVLGAVIGATALAPAAYARHRIHHRAMAVMPAVPQRVNAMGQFYATPLSAGGIGAPGLGVIPGLDLGVGAVNGIANPILGTGGALPGLVGPNGLVIPGLDAAGNVITGVTQPLIPPAS